MRTKIVLWGANEKDEKLLVGVELLQEENQVKLYTFPEKIATEAFYNQMMNLWRDNQPIVFPEGHTEIVRPLTLSDDLLPETIKVDRTDIISRAKAEWHFVVLSAKLYDSFKTDIEDFKERIEHLTSFDSNTWDELKGFWDKVQGHVFEKSLFKDHADGLKNGVNDLFGRMKDLRKIEYAVFEQKSGELRDGFFAKLDDVLDRVEKGLGLQPIFNELKKLQSEFRNTEFTKMDQRKVWKKLDGAFKTVKEKKFGNKGNDHSAVQRISRRHGGLVSAIGKMEQSIKRDRDEIEFQNRKIATTQGQLELQIRQAKLAMIQERINSKEEKLKDMLKTKDSLDSKLSNERKKEEQKAAADAKKAAATKTETPKKEEEKADATKAKEVKPDESQKADAPKVEATTTVEKATEKVAEATTKKAATADKKVEKIIPVALPKDEGTGKSEEE